MLQLGVHNSSMPLEGWFETRHSPISAQFVGRQRLWGLIDRLCDRLLTMREIIWGWLTAAIGLVVLVLLALYGIEVGTWIDEAGPLQTAPPTFIIPFAIGGLGLVLLVGGFIVGVAATAKDVQSRP